MYVPLSTERWSPYHGDDPSTRGRPTNYFDQELFFGQFIRVDEQTFFSKGVDTQQLIAEQQPARDARFLLDSGFQPPRSVRLGVSLSF